MSNTHPDHYRGDGIECIDAIKASMTAEEFLGFCKGNIMKYVWRYEDKGGVDDLEKAGVYLKWIKEELKGEPDEIKRFFGDDVDLEAFKRKLDWIIAGNMLKPYGREVEFNIDEGTVDFTFYVDEDIKDEIEKVMDAVRELPGIKDWSFTNITRIFDGIKVTMDIDIREIELINTIFEFMTRKGFSVL